MKPTITAFERSPDGGKGLPRDTRVRWALEERGQSYDVRLVSFQAMKLSAHLALHPFGQIPTYEEGELAVFETGAIVFHIAERHAGLLPQAPEAERDNWGARWALDQFQNRMKLVKRQLARAPYMAGENFTAADISVTYTLNLASRRGGIVLDAQERAYMDRTTARDGYKRALDACPGTKGFYAAVPAL